MVDFSENTTVRAIVARYPRTRDVFERFGVDYCCNGQRPLGEAVRAADADLDDLRAALDKALSAPDEWVFASPDWSQATATELADHIEARHHTFLRERLPLLLGRLEALQRAHAEKHGEMLALVEGVLRRLASEVGDHLFKEEQILFPLVRALDACARGEGAVPQSRCGTVRNPIAQMEHEHDAVGDMLRELRELRELTDDYTAPTDGCETFRAFCDGLRALETDLHEHIHLENNILFPLATTVEQQCFAKSEAATPV